MKHYKLKILDTFAVEDYSIHAESLQEAVQTFAEENDLWHYCAEDEVEITLTVYGRIIDPDTELHTSFSHVDITVTKPDDWY